jgi:hypothetical protein
MEREEGGPDAALALYADWPRQIGGTASAGRRGRAGRAPQSAEPGAGSAGPGAAQRRRLLVMKGQFGSALAEFMPCGQDPPLDPCATLTEQVGVHSELPA